MRIVKTFLLITAVTASLVITTGCFDTVVNDNRNGMGIKSPVVITVNWGTNHGSSVVPIGSIFCDSIQVFPCSLGDTMVRDTIGHYYNVHQTKYIVSNNSQLFATVTFNSNGTVNINSDTTACQGLFWRISN